MSIPGRVCRTAVLLWSAFFGRAVHAQEGVAGQADTWVTAFTFGLPGYRSQTEAELFTFGIQVTQLRPNSLSGDFAIGTMPRALVEGLGVVGMRGGAALPMRLSPNAFLIPSVGVSLIGVMTEGGGGGATGANAGFSIVSCPERGGGVRAGITWHRFADLEGPVWLLEVGIIPRGARRSN